MIPANFLVWFAQTTSLVSLFRTLFVLTFRRPTDGEASIDSGSRTIPEIDISLLKNESALPML